MLEGSGKYYLNLNLTQFLANRNFKRWGCPPFGIKKNDFKLDTKNSDRTTKVKKDKTEEFFMAPKEFRHYHQPNNY